MLFDFLCVLCVPLRLCVEIERKSTAAERGDDHDFVSWSQALVEALRHLSIDEKPDVLADTVLFVDDAMAHAGKSFIQRAQQGGQRIAPGFHLSLPAGIGKQRTGDEDVNQAAVIE